MYYFLLFLGVIVLLSLLARRFPEQRQVRTRERERAESGQRTRSED